MGHRISLSTPSGAISAWRADPAIPARGAIVVVQEIFGVNAHIRSVTEQFAAHGFVAIAPAFFDHMESGVELTYDEAGVSRGRELAAQLSFDRTVQDVKAAAENVQEFGHVGVVGFCWGGSVAFLSCVRLGLATVSYYGSRTVPLLLERTNAPLMLHFGEFDPLISPEDVQKHREALPAAEIHVWPAGHGFNCDQRADYNADVAARAWQRTLNFFWQHLR